MPREPASWLNAWAWGPRRAGSLPAPLAEPRQWGPNCPNRLGDD
jgi:hypothetical protein